MHAEVISIGDELTSGQRLDTNSQWLSQRLSESGIRVLFHTTVGDDLEANTEVFRRAIERAEIIVTTGGLGPTADDLTRDALAAATSTDLVLDEPSLVHIRALFARRKREMPPRNEIQAMIPRGSHAVPNPHGSAPGIDMTISRGGRSSARMFCLPGVPAEMVEMWQQSVQPAIEAMLGGGRRVIRTRTIKCFGVGESDLESMLPDLIRRGRQPTVGITVSRATISLRIVAEGATEADCIQQIEPTVATIQECLGTLVFGEADEELSHAVVRLLTTSKSTLATGEADSGGLMAHWLSEADPSRGWVRGGILCRTESIDTANRVVDLAQKARSMFDADYGLALGSFPTADSPQSQPGNIHMALASPAGVKSASYPFAGHPDILKPRAVKQALNFLRLELMRTVRVSS